MNENLENQLAEVLKKALEIAEKTGEFAIEQAPQLLQEFYMWHIIKESMTASISLIFIIIIYWALAKFRRTDDFDWEEEHCLGIHIVAVFISLAPIFLFFMSIYRIVFINIAPKLYLIEYFMK